MLPCLLAMSHWMCAVLKKNSLSYTLNSFCTWNGNFGLWWDRGKASLSFFFFFPLRKFFPKLSFTVLLLWIHSLYGSGCCVPTEIYTKAFSFWEIVWKGETTNNFECWQLCYKTHLSNWNSMNLAKLIITIKINY